MMTRETKAGILVSCSFLCLVGIVLFSKLNEKEEATTASTEADESGWVKAPDEPQPTDPSESGGQPTAAKEPARLTLTAGQDAPPVKNTATPSDASSKSTSPVAASATPTKETSVPKFDGWPPVTPAPAPKMASAQPEKKQSSEVVAPIIDLPPAKDPKTAAVTSIKPEDKKTERSAQDKQLVQIPAPPPPAPGLVTTPAPAPQPQKSWWDDNPKSDLKLDTKSVPSNAAVNSPVAPVQPDRGFGTSTTAPMATAPKADPAPNWSKPSEPIQPDRGLGTSTTAPVVSAPKADPAPNWSKPSEPKQDAPVSASGDPFAGRSTGSAATGSTPTFNLGASPSPAREAPRVVAPPIEAPVTASSAPIRVSAPPSNSPAVESYDEETFTCRPTESFQTISQNFFQTDKYARALLLFNRDHPLANSAVKNDPPVLQAGQQVYVPPARILEKYYAAAIDSKSAAVPAVPTGTRVGILSGPETPAPPPATAIRADAASTYRVAGSGEMIRDIARRTLGDAERWPEIYRLNPNIDPKDAVPAGSELRLPTAGGGSS
jgi:hypothetical protein